MITDRQTRLLRQKRMEGKTQETAAAKAGMSVRSARKWQSGPLPSQAKPEHRWRTRPDPFDGVWEDEIEPLLRNDPTGKLKATTIIDWLAEQHPGRFSASQTLQRRFFSGAAWSGSGGVLPPGASAGTGGPVRLHPLRGTQGDHRRTVLPPPAVPADTQPLGMALRCAAGETFLALQQGLQNALWTLGGVPEVVRSDNTAAATHELRSSRGRALNDNYAALLDHYGLRSTRINPGQSHENGVAEHAHYRLKDAIDQALILRGSRDFDTVDDYASFVRQMVERRNRLVEGKLEQEMACLGPLPPAPVPEYVNYQSKVRKWCTIQVAGHSYSVPSRLIGKEVQIRLYADWVEVLPGPPGGTDGTGAWRGGSQRQLPPRHWVAGAQAWSLRPLPLPGAAISHHALQADLRRAPAVAWGACRRGVRADPAPGGHHHGSHGGQRAVVAAGGG